jgi:hypothetical protein
VPPQAVTILVASLSLALEWRGLLKPKPQTPNPKQVVHISLLSPLFQFSGLTVSTWRFFFSMSEGMVVGFFTVELLLRFICATRLSSYPFGHTVETSALFPTLTPMCLNLSLSLSLCDLSQATRKRRHSASKFRI